MRTGFYIFASLFLLASAPSGACTTGDISLSASGDVVAGPGSNNLYLSAPNRARFQITTADGKTETLHFSFSVANNMITLMPEPDTPAPVLELYSLTDTILYCPECYRIRLPAYWHTFAAPDTNQACEQSHAAIGKGGAV